MRRGLSAYLKDRSGAIAPLVAVSLIALVAAGGIAWDVSRGFALRGELDSVVDASALAGATQLDGQLDARARARAAAKGALVQNAQRLARTREANVAITDADITFLQDLTNRTPATTDANAQFIQLNLTPRSMGVVMGSLARAAAFSVTAHAVAGYGSALCLVPPILICNPNEPAGNTDKYYAFDGDSYTGRAIVLTPSPQNTTAPGNFGFLDVGNGANALKEALGRNPPITQCFGDQVVTEPGNKTSVDAWFNTRFDIYRTAGADGVKADPAYAPSLNTMVGAKATAGACDPGALPAVPNTCSDSAQVASGYGFPKDCGMSGVMGSGQWNVGKYFNTNHNGVTTPSSPTSIPYSPPTLAGSAYPGTGWASYGPPAVGSGTTPTRFQVYNWELAILSGAISKPVGAFSPDGQDATAQAGSHDFARPSCNRTNMTQASPDRRLISAVVANCEANGVKGKTPGVVISANLDLFLIAPATASEVYGEIVRATPASAAPIGQATKRFWVRLYE